MNIDLIQCGNFVVEVIFPINKRQIHWIRVSNDNGDTVKYKNSSGFERWSEYNSNGNEIHYKNSDGDEQWYTYDGNWGSHCILDI